MEVEGRKGGTIHPTKVIAHTRRINTFQITEIESLGWLISLLAAPLQTIPSYANA